MNTNLKALASLVLVSALAGAHAEAPAAGPDPAPKTRKHARVVKSTKPSVESQIEALRTDLSAQKTQIDTLQQQLSASQQQLTQAQAAAQSAMQQAQDAMSTQQAAIQQNTQSVNTLQSAVTDLTANNASMASTLQADQAATKKMIQHPDSIGYKGITLSPTGSFIAFETVNRTKATASDIATPFSAIPFSASDAGQLSEFFATARQSRLALTAEGKLNSVTLRGYYETDFLGTGVTSNNNQSNSYVLRERQLWGQASFKNGFTVTGGQMWSLVTENKTGVDPKSEAIVQNIDVNYNTGFVFARQPALRVAYKASPMFSGAFSIEQAQTLAPGCSASTGGFCAINYLAGATGTGSGLYNGAGAPGVVSVGGSTTITTAPTDAFNAPVTTYSYNLAPDMMAKLAADSKYAHAEIFGVARVFRNRIYPNESPQTGKALLTTVPAGSGAYNNATVGGGVGGNVRLKLLSDKLEIDAKGLFGDGISRYGATQLADLTLKPNGQFSLLHGYSALLSVEANPTPRLSINFYYGGDYVGRDYYTDGTGTGTAGYGSRLLATSGCGTELAPGTTVGGAASTGTVNGFSPTAVGSCAVNTKDVQEGAAVVWYDLYRGPMGRIREGVHYEYIERNTWSGLGGLAPKAIDNVILTSFRYYLP